MKANLVLKNGIVLTVVGDATAEAVAVAGDTIVYVGTNAGVEEFIDADTKVIDLEGKTVTPGFVDGHTHDVMHMIDADTTFFFDTVESTMEAYSEAFAAFVAERPDNEYYFGDVMDLTIYEDGKNNNKWLNDICADKPICIKDISGHCFLVNDAGAKLIGLTRDTQVEGANIFKYEDGEPTGFVADGLPLLLSFPTPERTPEMYRKAFLQYQDLANSYGITAIDGAGPIIDPPLVWKLLHEMEEAGELKLRANIGYLDWSGMILDEAAADRYIASLNEGQKYNSDFQKVSQAKTLLDGVPEARSVRLLEPYEPMEEGEEPYYGPIYQDAENLKKFIAKLNAAGYQMHIHSMGDGSARVAVDCYEYSAQQNGPGDYRNIIAHLTLIHPDDIKRAGELGVYGSMQPNWWYMEPVFGALEGRNLGPERIQAEYPTRDMVDAGMTISGSIDYPVLPDFRPLVGMQSGATRQSPYPGQRDDPATIRSIEQKLTQQEMLEVYTINGAKQMRMEDKIGTLEVGKKADMVVLDQNIVACDPKVIADTKIFYTIMNGNIVFEG